MSIEATSEAYQLPIRKDLITGIDVGGTKIHIADTLTTAIRRYNTPEYERMEDVLDEYIQTMGARPAKVFVGVAGPRNDDTGEIELTNADWPTFNPQAAALAYGIEFATALDMATIAAGVLQETSVDLLPLKPGTPTRTGTKMVVALSTGVGTSAAVWDSHSKKYVVIDGLGGHTGFQPKTEEEYQYLRYLLKQNSHASVERALSGKHGIDNLVNHSLESVKAPRLADAVARARLEHRPVGAVLLEFARQGEGMDQKVAHSILGRMGALLGAAMRDWTLTYHATGGVYLTGSVALALGEYLAQHTDMNDRFAVNGPENDTWLEKVPISLVTDPNVAVVGALSLAKGMQ
jgi:glucokinase